MPSPRELMRVLESYVAESASERESLDRFRDLLGARSDPFTREEPEHVTASAIVARPSGESFLLVHHRRLDRWLQPGGHVEPDDASTFAAALRETREETAARNLSAPFGELLLDLDVHPVPAGRGQPAHVHYDVRHLLTTAEHAVDAVTREIRAARWFSYAQVLEHGADASLTRALEKASRRLTES